MNKKELGNLGERITCKYLEQNNYTILEKNFFFKGGEIDVIAVDNVQNEIVFIEVKTRANTRYGLPIEAVDAQKICHILKGANYYIFTKKLVNVKVRFDVVEVYYKGKFFINHIKEII